MHTPTVNERRLHPQSALSQPGQQVTLTRPGKEGESLSVVVNQAVGNREAIDRWLSHSADRKANPRNGGAAAVRRLRDGR